jgi:hypothetical protein
MADLEARMGQLRAPDRAHDRHCASVPRSAANLTYNIRRLVTLNGWPPHEAEPARSAPRARRVD